MMYATEASIVSGATRQRIRDLTRLLADYGCVSRVEWHRSVIVVELPEDDVTWILTGGFAEVLHAFEDCLRWQPRFREHGRQPASLPAPRLRA